LRARTFWTDRALESALRRRPRHRRHRNAARTAGARRPARLRPDPVAPLRPPGGPARRHGPCPPRRGRDDGRRPAAPPGAPARAPPRASGSSKYRLKDLLALALRSLVSFSKAPLHLAAALGAAFALAGLLPGLGLLLAGLLGRPVPASAALLSAVVFLGGVQLL